jgi:hypothetical protein
MGRCKPCYLGKQSSVPRMLCILLDSILYLILLLLIVHQRKKQDIFRLQLLLRKTCGGIHVLIIVNLSYCTYYSLPSFQPSTPPARPYEAPTPGSGWANTPGGSYNDAPTPRDSYGNPPSLELLYLLSL